MLKQFAIAFLLIITILLGASVEIPLKPSSKHIHKKSLKMTWQIPNSHDNIHLIILKDTQKSKITMFSLKVAGIDYRVNECIIKEFSRAQLTGVEMYYAPQGYDLIVKIPLLPSPEQRISKEDLWLKFWDSEHALASLTTVTTEGSSQKKEIECGV